MFLKILARTCYGRTCGANTVCHQTSIRKCAAGYVLSKDKINCVQESNFNIRKN